MRSADRPARSRARRSRAPRPSRSRSRSPARTGPGRPPTRSSRPSAAGRSARAACRSRCQSSIATSSGPSLTGGRRHARSTQTRSQSSRMCSRTNSRRELDRALLEVLPEREVAEHLEERQVVSVEPDLVDVGGAEGLLRRGRAAAPAAAPGRGSTASSAASRPSSAASCGRPRAGRGTRMAHACGPSTRRMRDIPRAALRSSACVDCRPGARAGQPQRLRRPSPARAGLRLPAPSPSHRRRSGST